MKRLSTLLIVLLFCLGFAACQPTATLTTEPTAVSVKPTAVPVEPTATPVPVQPTATAIPEPILEIVTDTESMALTLDELMALAVVEGQAGIKSSTGKITLPTAFTGVTLKDLTDLVGGIDETMGINLVAEDGYSISFSYDQIMNGTFIAYDPATGDELKDAPALQPLLAFEIDGQLLDTKSDGNLRLVIISEEGNQVTDGHWSVKWVNKIEVKSFVQDWTLQLNGAINETVDRASIESCINCHEASWTDDKAQVWKGVPLYLLLGFVDDEIKHEGPAFNDDVAAGGYSFDLIAADGYTVTMESGPAARNASWIVAALVDGNPLPDKYFPLRLVGDELEKNQMAGAITTIQLNLDGAAAEPVVDTVNTLEPAAEGELPVVAADQADVVFSGLISAETGMDEAGLRSMEVVKITAEHPKKGSEEYEGVRLNSILDLLGIKEGAVSLVFTAADGFSAEVSLADVRACTDCLLAFTNTEGKMKMVMPGMDSNAWVKDISKIEVK
ncbi:MAG: hypothetical protein CVU39_26865 [Chloroflexi bacterium HGW-Chloroflexi-10]|nr:MAG: hypothetical protein CVU39_26865 [Chloroflexi bacterium HGW-Chloroflexi-10]